MTVIEGATGNFDFRAFQQQQAKLTEPSPTSSLNEVKPPNAVETPNKFVQEAIEERQIALQNTNLFSLSTEPTQEILNRRVEVAPDIDANQARNRYEETSGGPTNLPENYTQVALDA